MGTILSHAKRTLGLLLILHWSYTFHTLLTSFGCRVYKLVSWYDACKGKNSVESCSGCFLIILKSVFFLPYFTSYIILLLGWTRIDVFYWWPKWLLCLYDHMQRHQHLHTYSVYIVPNRCCFQINSLVFAAFFMAKKVTSIIIILFVHHKNWWKIREFIESICL